MTWNLVGQTLSAVLACILVWRVVHIRIHRANWAIIAFVGFQFLQASIYIVFRAFGQSFLDRVDYRWFWTSETIVKWLVTIWLVYALLIAILKQLPGILRFSLRILTLAFGTAAFLAIITVKPEYQANAFTMVQFWSDWKVRTTALVLVLDRAVAFAELLSILAILAFFLRFPVRVPRNLATLSIGLSATLFLEISLLLLRTYLPALYPQMAMDPLPLISAACLLYWIFSLSAQGEQTEVTLGRGWDAIPKEYLVLQLEALNASLLQSRK